MWLSILYDPRRVTLVHTRKKRKTKQKRSRGFFLASILQYNEAKFEFAFSLFHPIMK